MVYQCQGTNVGPLGSLRRGNGSETGGVPFVTHTLRAEGCDASEDGTGRGTPLVPYIVNAAESCAVESHARLSGIARSLDTTGGFSANQGGTVVAFNPQAGGKQTTLGCSANGTGSLNVSQIPAISTSTSVRRLTPVECLRLQGAPDDWLDLEPLLSDSAKYRLIGNAVAVPVVEWIARRLCEHLD
jgi:DNA (cytosine-5)-methyltransferase 1